jgi:hypothetical protein
VSTTTTSLRALAAVAALVLVAACGGGSDSDGPAVAETSAPATTSAPTADAPQEVERPEDERTDAGAIAFSAYAVQTIVATSGGASLDDFLQLATDSCDGCIRLAQQVGPDPTEVQRFDGPPTVTDATVAKKDGADYVVDQTVSVPAGQKVKTADSSVVSEIEAATYRFVVRASWKDDRWLLANYSVEKTS